MAEIDLSLLPAPEVVEPLDYETILADRVARMKLELASAGILPDWDPTLESDTIVKLLQESAYREMILRGRVNDAARAVLLAHATGANLEHLAAFYGIRRLTGELDSRLRRRAQMALEGFTSAGPRKAYIKHALDADVRVKDADTSRPQPGDVLVTVLGSDGDGTPPQDVLDAVAAALSDEDVRPLCDTVLVRAATILPYDVIARVKLFGGPDAGAVLDAARAKAAAYGETCHALGAVVARSGLDAAIHQTGVQTVTLLSPAADIVPDKLTAPWLRSLTIEVDDGN